MSKKVNQSQTKKKNKLESQQIRQLSKQQAQIFLKTCNAFLADIIQKEKIDLDSIQHYFQPTSNLEEITLQSLFLSLISSAANANMLSNVIEFADRKNREKEISQEGSRKDRILEAISGHKELATQSFTDEEFKPYLRTLSEFDVETAFTNLKEKALVKGDGKVLWYRWLNSVKDAAAFTMRYETGETFVQHFNAISPDFLFAGPLIIQRYIIGIGFALACDALKELGFTQYVKPDTHINDVFIELNLAKASKDNLSKQLNVFDAAIALVQKINSSLPLEEHITAYELDKIIWLCCSGKFYKEGITIHDGKRDLKEKLIERLRNNLT